MTHSLKSSKLRTSHSAESHRRSFVTLGCFYVTQILSHYMSKFPSNQFHVISGECMRVNCVSLCLPNDECALYVWDCRLDFYALHEYAFHLNYVPFHACVFSCTKFLRTRFGTLTPRTFRLLLTASNSCLKIKRKSHVAYFFSHHQIRILL